MDLPPPLIASRDDTADTMKFGDLTVLSDAMAEQVQGFFNARIAVPPVLVEVDGARQVRDIIASARATLTS